MAQTKDRGIAYYNNSGDNSFSENFLINSVGDKSVSFLKAVLKVVFELKPELNAIPNIFNCLCLPDNKARFTSKIRYLLINWKKFRWYSLFSNQESTCIGMPNSLASCGRLNSLSR